MRLTYVSGSTLYNWFDLESFVESIRSGSNFVGNLDVRVGRSISRRRDGSGERFSSIRRFRGRGTVRSEIVGEFFHERSSRGSLLSDFDGVGWCSSSVERYLLDVLFERNDDSEISRLELRTNSGVLSNIVTHRFSNTSPLSSISDLWADLESVMTPLQREGESCETYREVTTESSYFSLESPKIHRFTHNRRNDHSCTSVLTMEEVELLEEVERSTS